MQALFEFFRTCLFFKRFCQLELEGKCIQEIPYTITIFINSFTEFLIVGSQIIAVVIGILKTMIICANWQFPVVMNIRFWCTSTIYCQHFWCEVFSLVFSILLWIIFIQGKDFSTYPTTEPVELSLNCLWETFYW